MNNLVKDLMTEMPHTIGHDIPVSRAKAMMKEFSCHHLPVLDGGSLVGLISDRDLRVVDSLKEEEQTPVEILMNDEPIVVSPDKTIKETVQLMLDRKIGSVIVRAKEGNPWGIFTSTDALKLLVESM